MVDPSEPAKSVLREAISDDEIRTLFSSAGLRSFTKGQSIFVAGDSGDGCMLIQSGRVEISITSMSGRKSVLNHMAPGEIVGEIAALDGGVRSADAVAAGKVTGLMLSRDNLLAFVAARPLIAQAIIGELCRKVRNASDMFSTISETEGAARLASGLLRLFDQWAVDDETGDLVLGERFSQSELGEFSGLARENVNRHLKSWAQLGILDIQRSGIRLLNRDALEDIRDG